MNFDKRLTPARPDLAAEHLREQIEAEAYAPGRRMQVRVSHVNVQRKPSDDAPTETQALHGETLIAYEERAAGAGCNSIATAMSATFARRPSPKTS